MGAEQEIKDKLTKLLGAEDSARLVQEVLDELGLADLSTPDQRFKFAAVLIDKGGLFEAVGRSIRVQALLQGANDDRAERKSR